MSGLDATVASQCEQGLELEQGRAQGEASAIITVLTARGLRVPGQARRRILTCTDPAQLTTWLERSITAPRVDDLFA